jgi:hypothetical protein
MSDSQLIQLQRHLAKGLAITPMGALDKWGCFRLGARIHQLRKQRWPISTTMIQSGHKRFASYRMDTRKGKR